MLELLLPAFLAVAAWSQGVLAILDEYDAMAAHGEELWPGFQPAAVPLLIFDGTATWLRGHPAPPPEFTATDRPKIRRVDGRHPAVRANTSIELSGSGAASLVVTADRGARDMAAVAIHEAFHVYQDARHPAWNANELDLLTMPFDDAEALAARRIETELLRLALAADGDERPRLARAACAQRAARAAAGSVAYERGIELKEGLAQYVQHRALRAPAELPADGFGAEALRARGYATGEAWATLLDAFAPDWKQALENGAPSLDGLLATAFDARATASTPAAELDPERLAALRARAAGDAANVAQERAAALAAFQGAAGWTLEVRTQRPLFPSGFDPMNVRAVGGGAVLHTRWIALSNDAGSVEVLDRSALTEPAGEHPLFQGVRRLVVTGLPDEPRPAQSDGALVFAGAGVTLQLVGAAAEALPEARTVRVTLP